MPPRPPLHLAATRTALTLATGIGCALGLPAQARPPLPPPASQGFDPAECRDGCTADTIAIDVARGRKAQPGDVSITLTLIDTLLIPKRGAPPAPRERSVSVIVFADSAPAGAAVVSGRSTDKRLDDDRVIRRAVVSWSPPGPLLARLSPATTIAVMVDRRAHPLQEATVAATRTLLDAVKSSLPTGQYSARAALYIATFAAFGQPGDSTLSEDVGTATEPLMIPTSNTTAPTRVATLNVVGRGPHARALLVQDDATGAAPIFGINENVTIALPGRSGRRGVVVGKVAARQRVESPVDTCAGTKYWTYLITLSPPDLASVQRGLLPSARPGDLVDRWNGVAVREPIASRQSAAEARQIAGSRAAVAQLVRDHAATGLRDRDVQVLAALPRGGGYVTNFGVILRESGGAGWRTPALTLRTAACR
jgi:hypothetical protein